MFTLWDLDSSDRLTQPHEFESQHASTARLKATVLAGELSRDVAVVAGETIRYVMTPKGTQRFAKGTVPANAKGICQRGTRPGPCWCGACRAERKAKQ